MTAASHPPVPTLPSSTKGCLTTHVCSISRVCKRSVNLGSCIIDREALAELAAAPEVLPKASPTGTRLQPQPCFFVYVASMLNELHGGDLGVQGTPSRMSAAR